MHVKLAFVAGYVTHLLSQRETLPLETIAAETAALRSEIRVAREAVLELQLGREDCEWQVWTQKWIVRLSIVIDFLVVIWVLWKLKPRTVAPRPIILADTGGSSSDTDSQELVLPQKLPWVGGGKGTGGRGRPSRPSDFKGGK